MNFKPSICTAHLDLSADGGFGGLLSTSWSRPQRCMVACRLRPSDDQQVYASSSPVAFTMPHRTTLTTDVRGNQSSRPTFAMLAVAKIARSKHVSLALAAAAALLWSRSRPRKGVKTEAVSKPCDGRIDADAEQQPVANVSCTSACTSPVTTRTLD